ncbi:bifunctional 2',3'-cyclic-nucleotide 2'-phosphodiesterase/3'-nucleotidase [Natroniella sulfidigena]|uniref:bifunctional 2',3'-cyclic-nucleotide 2'-phosphodiesterase/3'-nucleotidase n=1 Tax=Natroniella sulfidigena TaxID=723921 RepID=UPI002009F731|nr:bifunctional 2',3'-cyclic-nucleotide 2'-phosphodiesterase/3'-nucleotidase [Natroniella sulfidigena]MCK8817829.1 bifunctional 2',3'-cyclic-nucleotide 2'-phosphodiesterase/3'-nucleotidase [Natroniella sulfidigena]
MKAKIISKIGILTLAFMLAFSMAVLPEVSAQEGELHELTIMSTTDIHSYIMPHDYLNDNEVDSYGLVKTATLIDQMRANNDNTLLFDTGDLIQGSLLGNIEAVVDPIQDGEVHATIDSMNMIGYDAAITGNHEFNFGLEFLERAYSDAEFPLVNANVYEAGTDENYFTPYKILEREVDGEEINVGVIGFVPPQIMVWDKLHLEGEVEAREIVETAEKFVPEMKAEGADIILAVAHTGIDESEGASENAAYHLSQVEGIDAMLLGHEHRRFPSNDYEGIDGVDIEQGTINGVPAVMPGAWGSHLGAINLSLTNDSNGWQIVDSQSEVTAVDGDVKLEQEITESVQEKHEATVDYVNTDVGETFANLNTFFSRVKDNKVVQLVNDAQLWFADNYFEETEYSDLPVLSAAAPFKAGRHGADYFTDVSEGGIAVRDVAEIYIYDNTLQVVKVDGEEVIDWLERSAENFNQIDPSETEDQVLLDYGFRGFNFDQIAGIEYEIDVTQPIGERIVDATYEGEPLTADMEFLAVTNNYRASGGGDHLNDAEVVYQGTEENREVIIDYIQETGGADPEVTDYWSIAPVETEGRVVFRSYPNATEHMTNSEAAYIDYVGEEDDWGLYEYDLSVEQEETTSLWDRIRAFWSGLWS